MLVTMSHAEHKHKEISKTHAATAKHTFGHFASVLVDIDLVEVTHQLEIWPK